MKISRLILIFFLLINSGGFNIFSQETPKLFVFTKTEGFRHTSIEIGIETIKRLGEKGNFEIYATEDSSILKNDLHNFDVLVFLNTTGDILNEDQQKEVVSFVKNGGGFVGIHSAADTEYDWPWYGKMVGAYFKNHPKKQEATINVCCSTHPSTNFFDGRSWSIFDEWYNYRDINPDINPVLCLDEKSYEGGENGDFHPIAWYHIYEGSRIFYTGMGHTEACYENPNYLKHILGGIKYVLEGENIKAPIRG